MKIENEWDSANHELVGRVTSELVNEMINHYFSHGEFITTLQKQLSTFEVKNGVRNRWTQATIQLNFDPVTFLGENEIRPGLVDEHTFMQLIEHILTFSIQMLEKMEKEKVSPYIAESFTSEIEKLTEKLRNKLLTINT